MELAPAPLTLYTIGQVSRAVNRTERTIRYWEHQGRIPPARRDGTTGRRLYTEADVRELQLMVYGDDLDVLRAR
jgi:DNA-binding transcriptional MerR regulator